MKRLFSSRTFALISYELCCIRAANRDNHDHQHDHHDPNAKTSGWDTRTVWPAARHAPLLRALNTYNVAVAVYNILIPEKVQKRPGAGKRERVVNDTIVCARYGRSPSCSHPIA